MQCGVGKQKQSILEKKRKKKRMKIDNFKPEMRKDEAYQSQGTVTLVVVVCVHASVCMYSVRRLNRSRINRIFAYNGGFLKPKNSFMK